VSTSLSSTCNAQEFRINEWLLLLTVIMKYEMSIAVTDERTKQSKRPVLLLLLFLDVSVVLLPPEPNRSKSGKNTPLVHVRNNRIIK
jgi:hypothetical protein